MASGPASGSNSNSTPKQHDDLEIARRLQEEFDKEAKESLQAPGIEKEQSKSSTTGDEEYARQLEAQLNNETYDEEQASTVKSKAKKGLSRNSSLAQRRQKYLSAKAASNHGYAKTNTNATPTWKIYTAYPESIVEALDELHRFTEVTIGTVCHACQEPLLQNFTVSSWFEKWIKKSRSQSTFSICAARCPEASCKRYTCIGCGREPRTKRFTATCKGMNLDWCCQQGRLFAFWVALCKYDETELQGQMLSEAKLAEHKARTAGAPSKSKGTGYEETSSYGASWDVFTTGFMNPCAMQFGGGWAGGFAARGPQMSHALSFQSTDQETDAAIGMILNVVIELLPIGNQSNREVPPALQAMIQLSILLDKVADMLRNDSLRNVNDRALVYSDVLEFVTRLGNNDKTRYLVCDRRILKKRSSGLQVISARESFDQKGKRKQHPNDGDDESSPLVVSSSKKDLATSVIGCMAKLASQAKNLSGVTKGGSYITQDFKTKEGKAITETASVIKKLDDALAPLSHEVKHSQKNGPGEWDAFHTDNRVNYDNSIDRYLCVKILQELNHITQSPMNRMRRIVSEQVEMSTGLPQYIFLKVHDSRPDIMKCLIVGPGGTPYEGGLFEFDILCPEQYPHCPPKVQIVTTGRGIVAFNPNLYSNGKVCLSLLGTWEGPPESKWQPHISTIASVLTSIQAFIFTDNPLENEPNYGNAAVSMPRQNRDYANQCQAFTIRFAMLDWLQRPEMRNGVWKDVVATYFRLHGDSILQRVKMWSQNNSLIRSFKSNFKRQVASCAIVLTPSRGFSGFNQQNLVKEFEMALSKADLGTQK